MQSAPISLGVHDSRNLLCVSDLCGHLRLFSYKDSEKTKKKWSLEVEKSISSSLMLGDVIVTGNEIGDISIVDVESKYEISSASLFEGSIHFIKKINENTIIAADETGTLKVIDIRSSDEVFFFYNEGELIDCK